MFKLNVIRKHSFARTKKHRMLHFCFFVFSFHALSVLCALSEKNIHRSDGLHAGKRCSDAVVIVALNVQASRCDV